MQPSTTRTAYLLCRVTPTALCCVSRADGHLTWLVLYVFFKSRLLIWCDREVASWPTFQSTAEKCTSILSTTLSLFYLKLYFHSLKHHPRYLLFCDFKIPRERWSLQIRKSSANVQRNKRNQISITTAYHKNCSHKLWVVDFVKRTFLSSVDGTGMVLWKRYLSTKQPERRWCRLTVAVVLKPYVKPHHHNKSLHNKSLFLAAYFASVQTFIS